jgi:glycosyltransferase involved in cell wall biosynthesis
VFSVHVDTARTWRGGQQQVHYTVLGLRALGHRAALVAPPDSELFARMREGHDLIPLSPQSEVDLAASWRLSRILKQLKPDVVHAHDPHAVAMASGALSLGAPAPRPVLVASRRIEYPIARNSLSRWKYRQVDCFIAVSEAVRERLVADGIPRDRVAVVHDGIDIGRLDRLEPVDVHAEFWLPHNAPVVGTVGALVAQKDQKHLVDAAALVVRDVPDARFVVLGEGELRESLERRIHEHRLERHVLLPGFRADALALMKTFDVFAISSIFEGLCSSIIDAMAEAKPCVGTRVGGVPEVIDDGVTGFLVEPRDPSALAARLVRLLKDPALRERMGAAGRARARALFGVERMVQGTADVYDRVARRVAPQAVS